MKTERIRTGATVTNDILVTDPAYVSYVIDSMHKEASRALMQRIGDGNEYIVRTNDREKDIIKLCEKEFTTTVHVAELVRCNDCEFWDTSWKPTRTKEGEYWCSAHDIYMGAEDYCSKAERRES